MKVENNYPYKILYVEDENATRKNYVMYLNMFFDEVYEACDGEEGYAIYKEKRPDILIIDINIPKLDGISLLKKIRENDFTSKAIMLTAHTDKQFLLDAAALKLTKYLVKPVSRKDFVDTLKIAIKELETYNISPIKKIDLKDNFSWDIELKDLKHHITSVDLTNRERSLLDLLFSRKNRVFTYDDIFGYVWEYEENISLNSLKNMIKRLRKKLPEDTIINIFNEGYKINF